MQGDGIIDQNGMTICTKSFSLGIGALKIPANCNQKYKWKFQVESAPPNEQDATSQSKTKFLSDE